MFSFSVKCAKIKKKVFPNRQRRRTYEKYDLIVISPTTANTVAKIVNGIADNLITNVVAQSGKGQIPLIIVPVDQESGLITTTLPPRINKDICKRCKIRPCYKPCWRMNRIIKKWEKLTNAIVSSNNGKQRRQNHRR